MSDIIFPTDNEYGIPTLIQQPQQLGVQAPVIVWGSTARTVKNAGTLCFYCDDYRFEALWRHPERVLASGAGAVVEPNYSIYIDTPVAVTLWHTYRKRWLGRFFQNAGMTVWVDICCPANLQHINLIGVPRGYQNYATAAWDSRVDDLPYELETARNHAAGYPYTVLVYGGGSKVTEFCKKSQADGHPIVRVGHRSDPRKRVGQWTRENSCKS